MSFSESVTTVFQKYATFSGRASRSEYWWFALFSVIVSIVLSAVDGATLQNGALPVIGSLAMLVPSLAVSARRLHDIDKSGWWMLIVVVPVIGFILYLIWLCTKGSVGQNRFGFPSES